MTCNCPEPNCQCSSNVVMSNVATCHYCEIGLHMRRADPPIAEDELRPRPELMRLAESEPEPTHTYERGGSSWSDHEDSLVMTESIDDARLAAGIGRTVVAIKTRRLRLKKKAANGQR